MMYGFMQVLTIFIGEYGAIDKDNGLDRETYLNALNLTGELFMDVQV